MRIAFFSPRSVGQLGTMGSYMLFNEMRNHCDVRVFAPGPGALSVWWDPCLPLIPMPARFPLDPAPEVRYAFRVFDPDVVYIFSQRSWPEVLEATREECPDARFVLDIRSILLMDDTKGKADLQAAGSRVLPGIDEIFTLSNDAVGSWFQDPVPSSRLIPMGIDVAAIRSETQPEIRGLSTSRTPWNLCYASTLHPLRQGDELLAGFADFLKFSPVDAVLHIIGDGPDRRRLIDLSEDLQIGEWVRFHGLLEQKALYRVMGEMDAGIAWVPAQKYDDQPSLKSLEYMAAGLPVLATRTRAHLHLQHEGFAVDYCECDPNSLSQGLLSWVQHGFSAERVRQNWLRVESHDFPELVKTRIVPVLESLV